MSEEKWKSKLNAEQYEICRLKGTEAPFTGALVANKEPGHYFCVACENLLFESDTKFDSGTGWPSFSEPSNLEHIELRQDRSHGMSRTEVICKNCGAHLGHVFNDGPVVAGDKRYCINSVCLNLAKRK